MSAVSSSAVPRGFDPRIQVGGKSGCQIELIDSGGSTLLRKHASTPDYSSRLIRQASKQRAFAQLSNAGRFRTPRVIDACTRTDTGLAYVDMEFVHAEKYSTFLAKVSADRLIAFTDSLTKYFDEAIRRSTRVDLQSRVLLDKLDAVTGRLSDSIAHDPVLIDARRLLRSPPSGHIFHGRCHGDFTLSNMLFHSDRVYLIDFLDSFIETPIHDIVKLRQDTQFGWSLMLEPELPSYQRDRVLQTLRFIDCHVDRWLAHKPDVKEWCNYLQVFNLYRILPYVSEHTEVSFVRNALESAVKACN